MGKMHAVTGTIVNQSGRTVNAGKVSLAFAGGDDEVASTYVDKDDNMFHFEYVPEGEYVLKVTEASDVVRTEIPHPPGTMPPSHTESKTLKSYAATQQSLVVQNEVNGIVVAVPDATAKQVPAP